MERLSLTRTHLLALLVLVCVLLLVGYWVIEQRQQARLADSTAGQVFNTRSNPLVNEAGEPVSLAIDERTVVVATFWASWVPSAPALLDTLATVATAKDQPHIRFVAINRSESASRTEAFFTQYERPDGVEIVIDTDDQLFAELDSYAMPETVVFDEAGDLVWRKRGDLSVSELTAALDQLE